MPCGVCLKTLADGIAGLSKVAAQSIGVDVDRADDATVAARRDVCRQCPHASKNPDTKYEKFGGLTTFSKCDQCGCFIKAKTLLASEKCPLQKW